MTPFGMGLGWISLFASLNRDDGLGGRPKMGQKAGYGKQRAAAQKLAHKKTRAPGCRGFYKYRTGWKSGHR